MQTSVGRSACSEAAGYKLNADIHYFGVGMRGNIKGGEMCNFCHFFCGMRTTPKNVVERELISLSKRAHFTAKNDSCFGFCTQ